jgi:hypothetical protein
VRLCSARAIEGSEGELLSKRMLSILLWHDYSLRSQGLSGHTGEADIELRDDCTCTMVAFKRMARH